jgi:pimeloyl-ACP methyl ester carboxylesterase
VATKKVTFNNKYFEINYDIANSGKKDIILFLHGWGSNKEVMKNAFLTKLDNFKQIYIDMPGFGKSQNQYILNTIDYSNIVKNFLDMLNINPNNITIVGHSFV